MRLSKAEKTGNFLNGLLMVILSLITIYPFWHIIMYALSDGTKALSGGIFLWPRDFTFTAIRGLMESKPIWQAYANTIYVTVMGTLINMVMTTMMAYPLSVKRVRCRGVIAMYVYFTMLFGGGMIPSYLLVKELGLIDSHWALILPGAIGAWNMFLMRNYFSSIPEALEESAMLDGASAFTIMVRIVLPLSVPVMATLALFYGVGHWNSYMSCVLYINDRSKQVLQVYLRTILSGASAMDQLNNTSVMEMRYDVTEDTMKMATVVISVLPILIVYPFIQKYYVKGIMIGSVKG